MSLPALYIFAKAPLAGTVKTRLQGTYTAEQAAEIAAVLIRETVARVIASWDGPIYLATTPTTEHPLFAELASRYALTLRAQHGVDLGERMYDAIAHGIARHGAAGVIGCDVPHCAPSTLTQAQRCLRAGRNVLGPALDGGYYLIGLTRAHPQLFDRIEWGGPEVWARTRDRLHSLDLPYELLPALRDIDTAEDLRDAAAQVAALRRFLV